MVKYRFTYAKVQKSLEDVYKRQAHTYTLPVLHPTAAAFNAPVVFKNAWDFWEAREYSYKKKSPQMRCV